MAGSPTEEIGPRTKQDEDALSARRPWLQATLGVKTARRRWHEGRGGCHQTAPPTKADPSRLALAVDIR